MEHVHLKTAGRDNWGKLDEVMRVIARYRDRGIDVRFDRYPYTESQTMLSVILPPPFDRMSDRKITEELKDERVFDDLLRRVSAYDRERWTRWRLTGTTHPVWRRFIGKRYSELPGDPAQAVLEQLAHDADTATVGGMSMSEENMRRIILDDLCMPGSDGNALPADGTFGSTHPRAFGAIANFVRMKLDAGLSVGRTVRSVSAAPAEFFRLSGVGEIRCGNRADITVFSPDEIGSSADFASPCRPAEGIRMTMLDGEASYL